MIRRDLVASVALLALAAVYGLGVAGLPERTLPNTPGPRFFPTLIALALAALALALLGRSLAALRREAGRDGAGRAGALPAGAAARAAAMLGAFGLYLWALPLAGFLAATIPFFAVLMWLYRCERLGWLACGSLLAPGALYFLFRDGFQILLPAGPW